VETAAASAGMVSACGTFGHMLKARPTPAIAKGSRTSASRSAVYCG